MLFLIFTTYMTRLLQITAVVPYLLQDDHVLLKSGAELEWVAGYFSASQDCSFLQTSKLKK
jgi:hypothetical protein